MQVGKGGPREGGGVPDDKTPEEARGEWSPRGRGVPVDGEIPYVVRTWSPRGRGCSGAAANAVVGEVVVPARVGVFR